MPNNKYRASLSDLINEMAKGMSETELAECAVLFEISTTIEKRRKELGLSQKDFAKKLDVSQSMVSKWESGAYNFSVKILAQIASSLGLELENPLAYGTQGTCFVFTTMGNIHKPFNEKSVCDYKLIGGAA